MFIFYMLSTLIFNFVEDLFGSARNVILLLRSLFLIGLFAFYFNLKHLYYLNLYQLSFYCFLLYGLVPTYIQAIFSDRFEF